VSPGVWSAGDGRARPPVHSRRVDDGGGGHGLSRSRAVDRDDEDGIKAVTKQVNRTLCNGVL